MIHVRNCMNVNFTNSSGLDSGIVYIRDLLSIPAAILIFGVLVLAMTIMVALILSGCGKSPNAILYFNVTVTDAIMALSAFVVLIIPGNWHHFQGLALIILLLRLVFYAKSFIYGDGTCTC